MTESIIEESKQARRGKLKIPKILKNKKILIITILVVVIATVIFFMLKNNNSKAVEIVEKEWSVKQDDIKISIESEGKVVAKDGVDLSFSVSGDTLEVTQVYVKEGAEIKKGDKIASVRADDLQYDLNKAYSSYQSALASYNEKIAGATDNEIAKSLSSVEQAKISLGQTEISLEKTKASAKESIADAEDAVETAKENLQINQNELTSEDIKDAYEDLVDNIKSVNITTESILSGSNKIFNIDDSAYVLGVKNSSSLSSAKSSYESSKDAKEILDNYASILSYKSSYGNIDAATKQTDEVLNLMEKYLYDMEILLNNTITSSNFSQSQLDSFKSTINSNRSSINTKITSLNGYKKAVQEAKDGLDDYQEEYQNALDNLESTKEGAKQDIANSESSLAAKKLSLEQAQISHRELLAPISNSDLASAKSSLTTAAINVDKAKNDLAKATLTSPIDGVVAMLNYKAGDIILSNDSKPAATIINNNTLFIEVNIEEAEINKIKTGQKAYATFDAVDGLKLEGEISFISLTSETNNNGVVTYLVRIIFNNANESQIREGMTAFVDFVIAEANDVLVVPVDAVRNIEGKASVKLTTGEWAPVTTGFTDGKYAEVISGLSAGDKILY
ncbi:MAG: efflux RND transporter periplasmic adaptor subunit [Patescibacteria group bacterium]|jgi:HlyD family secretion protein